MTSLVNRKYLEWTQGLDVHQSFISVYEHIRDIPNSLEVPMTDLKTAPEQMLALGKGYCGPKHYLLADMYCRLGYEVVYATFPFLWNDPDLLYPPEIRQLASGLPVAHHLACRVRINNRWVLVDATWDRPLKQAGFSVNEHWDGRADTFCAVKPLRSIVRTAFCRTVTSESGGNRREQELEPLDGEQDNRDAEEYRRYYRNKTGMRTQEEIERIHQFYREFDVWLESIRKYR
jgi:hypothetical protein